MSNEFYSVTGSPGQRSFGSSAAIRAEFAAIQAAFDKLGTLSGNALKLQRVNAGETGYESDPSTYLTSAAAAGAFVAKTGDTMTGALVVGDASALPLSVLNSTLNGSSTSGLTGIWLGDAASGVPMFQRSKRTINTAGIILNAEYGFSVPIKVAEFWRDGVDLHVAGAAQLALRAGTATFTPFVYAPAYLFGTGLTTDSGTLGFIGGAGGGIECWGSASAGAGQVRLIAGGAARVFVEPAASVLFQSAASHVGTITNISDIAGSLVLQGTVANSGSDGLAYTSGGGGGAALVFSRDASLGTLIQLYTNPTSAGPVGSTVLALTIDQNGVISDGAGLELGYKVIPPLTLADGATLARTARGKCVTNSFTALTVPSGVFARGDSFAIYNDNVASMTLIQGTSVTLRLAGSNTTGSRTIGPRGFATVWFNGPSEAVVAGAGVS